MIVRHVYIRPAFKSPIWKNEPRPWEIWAFKGRFEVNISNGSGIRDPQFEFWEVLYYGSLLCSFVYFIYLLCPTYIYIYIYICMLLLLYYYMMLLLLLYFIHLFYSQSSILKQWAQALGDLSFEVNRSNSSGIRDPQIVVFAS